MVYGWHTDGLWYHAEGMAIPELVNRMEVVFMESEKLTLNIGAIDLGQIDLLVDQGFYSSRTDFIRTAIRSKLAAHAGEIENIKASSIFGIDLLDKELQRVNEEVKSIKELPPLVYDLDTKFGGTGVFSFNKKILEEVLAAGKKIEITMVGMLIVHNDVTAELAEQTFEKVRVYGMIKASEEVRKVLMGKR